MRSFHIWFYIPTYYCFKVEADSEEEARADIAARMGAGFIDITVEIVTPRRRAARYYRNNTARLQYERQTPLEKKRRKEWHDWEFTVYGDSDQHWTGIHVSTERCMLLPHGKCEDEEGVYVVHVKTLRREGPATGDFANEAEAILFCRKWAHKDWGYAVKQVGGTRLETPIDLYRPNAKNPPE